MSFDFSLPQNPYLQNQISNSTYLMKVVKASVSTKWTSICKMFRAVLLNVCLIYMNDYLAYYVTHLYQ